MDEFGMGSTSTPERFGRVLNPFDPMRSAGGSSGGAAASVSAGHADVSIGSDTGGSAQQPAVACGVIGFRPTFGVICKQGLVAYASSMDTIGIIAKRVDLIAHIFRSCEPASSLLSDIKSLRNARIGVFDGDFSLDNSLQFPKGAEKVVLPSGSIEYALRVYYTHALIEASSCLARFGNAPFGKEVRNRLQLGEYLSRDGRNIRFAMEQRELLKKEFERHFAKVALIALPTGEAPLLSSLNGTNEPWAIPKWEAMLNEPRTHNVELGKDSTQFTVIASLIGAPAISHRSGLQLIAPPFYDRRLLEYCSRWDSEVDSLDPMGPIFDNVL